MLFLALDLPLSLARTLSRRSLVQRCRQPRQWARVPSVALLLGSPPRLPPPLPRVIPSVFLDRCLVRRQERYPSLRSSPLRILGVCLTWDPNE